MLPVHSRLEAGDQMFSDQLINNCCTFAAVSVHNDRLDDRGQFGKNSASFGLNPSVSRSFLDIFRLEFIIEPFHVVDFPGYSHKIL